MKIQSRPLFERLLSPSDIAQHYDSEEADDDGSYVDKSENDLSFEADTEVGSLSALLRNQTLDISHLRDKGNAATKTKKTKKKTTTTTRKKPAQPPANIRKFFLFLLFLFCVVFITNPIAICVSIIVFFSSISIASHHGATAPKPPVSSICIRSIIMANYNLMEQHLLILEDGRVLVTKKLVTHFDGMLYIDDSCTKIYEETIYRKDHYCHIALHFKEYGVTHRNNIFQAQLQVKMNTMWAKYKDGTHGEPHVISVEEKNNTCVVTNLVDGEEESICVDLLPSGYWAVIVLKKKKEFTSPQRTRGGIHVRGHLANGTA